MENFEITSSNMIEIRIKLEEINTNIDEALCIILRETLSYLKKSDKKIDRTTEQTYHFYQNLAKGKRTEEK